MLERWFNDAVLSFVWQSISCNVISSNTFMQVTYHTDTFLDKNRDYVVVDHCSLLSSSKCPFVSDLFPLLPEESSRSSYKFSSVASRFKVYISIHFWVLLNLKGSIVMNKLHRRLKNLKLILFYVLIFSVSCPCVDLVDWNLSNNFKHLWKHLIQQSLIMFDVSSQILWIYHKSLRIQVSYINYAAGSVV